jgi:hypothetical protein
MPPYQIEANSTFEQNWEKFAEELKAIDETLAEALLGSIDTHPAADAGALREAVYAAAKLALAQETGQ